jgi:integrase
MRHQAIFRPHPRAVQFSGKSVATPRFLCLALSLAVHLHPANLGVFSGVFCQTARIDTPSVPLTAIAIRNCKPAARPYKLFDGGGLHLLVATRGSRLWRLKYRLGGREKLLSIGPYPTVSLKAAREARDRAKALLATGIDPSEAKKSARHAAEAVTSDSFKEIADEYLRKMRREGRAEATMKKAEWLLGFAYEKIGLRPIDAVTAPEVLEVLRELEDKGHYESAQRLRSVISRVFRYAVATARAETIRLFTPRRLNPTDGHLARAITDKKAFGALLRAIDGYDGHPTTRAALQLMALLFPRPGELRFAERGEFDLEHAIWTIPAAKTKMRRPHRVPLPSRALEILREVHAITGTSALVFPSLHSHSRPMSENTLNAALRQLGYSKGEATAQHGFRATFPRSPTRPGSGILMLSNARWHMLREIAHAARSSRRALEERVRMSDWWAGLLEDIRGKRHESTLVAST